ncbi:MAG: UDP-N-acetylmuramate dehydrogenase, partial [Actinomycetota bacterium]
MEPPVNEAAAFIARRVEGAMQTGRPAGPYTTYRLGGPAAISVEPAGEEDLAVVAAAMQTFGLDCLILGKGSNVLISDEGFPGIVVKLGAAFEWMNRDQDEVAAGGAAPLPKLANLAARNALTGLEFAVAIPATVGGAVRMNAGAHGASMSDVLTDARIYRLNRAEAQTITAADLEMKYRSTSLGPGEIVVSARFHLAQASPEEIRERMARYRRHRTETQPSDAPNAGSVFRNPRGKSAGGLIESAGLKGHRLGGAQISSKHANFFVAHPGATAQDVYDLIRLAQQEVRDRFG